ncbi:alpha/beta fold hydrolase [Candidatus Chloroploca sp. Khr17]|uniref:alpha/beta fold hydrolase n=1 Tax=Candidatus Chloroploca sp. Khr17 TaxID=2496869 RepID=UPI00101D3651|nr:alpha/beta hydrolase [Candidatus Chloroploca sp. Khr17]
MNTQHIKTKLGQVECSIIGAGVPVLFLHGGHSNCHERLAHKGFDRQTFLLITPSRPGYGNTPLGDSKTPQQAADLKDKTYRIARRIFHHRVERFTWGMVRLFSELMPRVIASNFFAEFSTQPTPTLRSADVSELVETLKAYRSGEGFLNDIDHAINKQLLGKIECPTLIVHSKNDHTVSLEHPHHAHQMISDSTLELVDNEWGHLLWLGEDAKEVTALIERFIVTP